MKNLFKTFAVLLLTALFTGCTVNDLTQVEPPSWEFKNFEREVTHAVRDAVSRPGIADGSTLIVTLEGDTIVAPADSLAAGKELRTLYVEIQSPAYPKGVSAKTFEIMTVITVISIIAGIILLILIGVFVVVIRRQHARNKAILSAIDNGYELPESFFTGTPGSPDITVNQLFESSGKKKESAETEGETSSCRGEREDVAPIDPEMVRTALKDAGNAVAPFSSKEARKGFVFIGIGIFLFLGLASMDLMPPAFIAGGTLVVLGAAKFIPYFFNRKF